MQMHAIMEGDLLWKTKVVAKYQNHGFQQMVLSWPIEDTLNNEVYKHQVFFSKCFCIVALCIHSCYFLFHVFKFL
ncbi:hypothetical protein HanIR_Chr12g0607031 [Helianthus annuus]|nr:hypothetical protein HanIR_Chr12g0607031 [Helianthus annuus]